MKAKYTTPRQHNADRINKLIDGLEYQEDIFDTSDPFGADIADAVRELKNDLMQMLKDYDVEFRPIHHPKRKDYRS